MALKLSMATRWGSSLSTRWIICTSVCSTPLLRRSRLAGDDRHRPRGNPTRTAVVQQHVDRAANPHGMSPTLTAARKKRVACSAATPKSPASCHNSALLPRDPRRIRFQGMHIRSFWGRFSLPLPAKSFSLAEEERSYGPCRSQPFGGRLSARVKLERGDASPGDFHVLISGATAHADSSEAVPIHQYREAPDERRIAIRPCGQGQR